MKVRVLSRDDNRLLVKMTPSAAWALLGFGALMIAGSPLVVWALSQGATIDLTDNELRYRTAYFDRYVSDEFVIDKQSVGAFSTESRDEGTTLVVAARAADSSLHKDMRLSMLNGDGKRELADRLNTYLDSGEPLSYSTGSDLALGVLLGLTLLGGGFVCLYFLQTSYVCGNRKTGELVVYVRRCLIPWRQRELGRVHLADIENVAAEAITVGGGTTPTASSNHVYVHTKDGQRLGLARGPMFTDASTEKISHVIESWVHAQPIASIAGSSRGYGS